jgi:hypothetical protein
MIKSLFARKVFINEDFSSDGDKIDISDRRYNRKVLSDIKGINHFNNIRIKDSVVP